MANLRDGPSVLVTFESEILHNEHDLREYSRKSGIALLGVLPHPLKSYTGSTLGEYSRKSGIVFLGVLPQA